MTARLVHLLNANCSIRLTLRGINIEVILVQSVNAKLPIFSKLSGNLISVKYLQPVKALLSIALTLSAIVQCSFAAGQSISVVLSLLYKMLSNDEYTSFRSLTLISFRPAQLSKTNNPISFTVSGRSIFSSLTQFLKASFFIVLRLSESLMLIKAEQLSKAPYSIERTLSEITALSNCLNSLKASSPMFVTPCSIIAFITGKLIHGFFVRLGAAWSHVAGSSTSKSYISPLPNMYRVPLLCSS